MELMDALMTLRAIRRFTDEPVTEDEIRTCLQAAQQAPSGGNIQPWQFLVLTDPETKRTIGDIYRRAYDRYEPLVIKAMPPPRSDEEAARRQRILNSSRHLADHIGEAPVLVAFLMPNIDDITGRTGPAGRGDTVRLGLSRRPELYARGAQSRHRHDADDGLPCVPGRATEALPDSKPLRDRRDGADGAPEGQIRRRRTASRAVHNPLGPLRRKEALAWRVCFAKCGSRECGAADFRMGTSSRHSEPLVAAKVR